MYKYIHIHRNYAIETSLGAKTHLCMTVTHSCIYVYRSIHTVYLSHTHTHLYIHTYTYIYIHRNYAIETSSGTKTHLCMTVTCVLSWHFAREETYIHRYMDVYIHRYINYAYTGICMTYIHRYMHVYIHRYIHDIHTRGYK